MTQPLDYEVVEKLGSTPDRGCAIPRAGISLVEPLKRLPLALKVHVIAEV